MRILKHLIVPKNLKGGPFGFLTFIKNSKGDNKKISKSHSTEKKSKGGGGAL